LWAITAYVLHGVLIDLFVIPMGDTTLKGASYQGLINLGLGMELASFIWAILYMLLCFIPIWIMYRKNIIVKI
jgi:predicted acyltransferase